MSCVEVLICFSLIALWFNAFLVPFKLFITVVVPVTWTYGAAFYVYEDGVLSWLGIPGVVRKERMTPWISDSDG